MYYKPKYFDKVYPIHLKALQDKDYKYLVFAYKYVLRFYNHQRYRNVVAKRRIRMLEKYGVRKRWKINPRDWDFLLCYLE